MPTKKILKSYIRKSSGEVGVIELLKKRLTIESQRLSPEEKHASLITDELTIEAME